MKKLSVIVFLFCTCFLMFACTASDPDNLFEMPLDTISDTETTQPDSGEMISFTGTYPYGNMQLGLDGFLLLDNEVIFTHIENGKSLLYAYDLKTEAIRLFCEDATCGHETCISSTLSFNLEVYHGKLYGLMWREEEKAKLIKYPAMVKGNVAESIIEANVERFFHYEEKLYMVTSDSSLVVLEKEQTEPRIAKEEFSVPESLVICGDYLYFKKYDGTFLRVDLTKDEYEEEVLLTNVLGKTDGEHIYYYDMNNFLLCRCDMDGKNPVRLSKKKIGNFNFDSEYFYFKLYTDRKKDLNMNAYDVYRFPKNDPSKMIKIATLPDPVGQIYTVPGTGKLFIQNYRADSSVEPVIYVMNTDGSDLKKLELPEA